MAPQEKSGNDMELVRQIAQYATNSMKLMGDLAMLVGIDLANISAETVLYQMFNRLMDTLQAGIPAGTSIPRRRRRNPKVAELAQRIYRLHFETEPDSSDRTLAWIEAEIVEILNDPELRQLKRDHNPRPLTRKRSRELLAILDRVETQRASSAA